MASVLMDDDGFVYASVPEVEAEPGLEEGEEDDIAALVQAMLGAKAGGDSSDHHAGAKGAEHAGTVRTRRDDVATPGASVPSVEYGPTVADDYIRNFLARHGMTHTLDTFNTEWYELRARGKLPADDALAVPDLYAENERLNATVARLQVELGHAQEVAARAQGTWEKLRRERDFHRMHHKRVVQEKNRLIGDMKRLKTHFQSYEPAIRDLRAKYEAAVREKMTARVEKDKLAARLAALEAVHAPVAGGGVAGVGPEGHDLTSAPPPSSKGSMARTSGGKTTTAHGRLASTGVGRHGRGAGGLGVGGTQAHATLDTPLPDDMDNPHLHVTYTPARVTEFAPGAVVHAHGGPVTSIACHPTKPVVATASDDATWRLWAMPQGELIMTGEGHRSWLADVDFHPSGVKLATCSGDGIIKVWDLTTASCIATYPDHTQTTWAVAFHVGGDFLLSASMDHTCRLFDVHTGKVRQTLRGHVDSVNAVCWQPYTPIAATGSGDKTVSLWDVRSGLSVQTFYGHTNAVNDVVVSCSGDAVASCDADGIVCYWDVRMAGERGVIDLGRLPAHGLSMDRAGTALAVACDDGVVRVVDIGAAGGAGGGKTLPGARTSATKMRVVASWKGHTDVVQAVAFDPTDRCLWSGGNDATLRAWADGSQPTDATSAMTALMGAATSGDGTEEGGGSALVGSGR